MGAVILALDLATTTGWAIGANGANPVSGTWDLAPARGESPGMRFVRLRSKLQHALEAFPDLRIVVYEQAHHRGGAATAIAAGLAAVVQEWCAVHRIEHASVHTGTLKRYATGSGRASKKHMLDAAIAKGWPTDSHDEADALHLLDYARKEIARW